MSELQKCITENKHAAVLLDEIKEFIIKKGEKLPTHEINQESANGNISTFSQRVAGDDIGMFMLKVKPLLII